MEIKRDAYLQRLIDKRNDGMIKVVTGIRRCGKSYLLDPLYKNYLLADGVPADHIIKAAVLTVPGRMQMLWKKKFFR